MSATYETALTRTLDHARLLLGDTYVAVAANADYSDEEYEAVLAAYDWNAAMAVLAQGLVTKYGREPSETEEFQGQRLRFADRLKALQQVLADARAGRLPEPGVARSVERFGSGFAANYGTF